MAEKAKKSRKDNKNLIIGCCAAFVLVVAIIITVVVLNNNTLNDSYFVSDNTKYVITIEADEMDSSDEEFAPVKTHQVFTYDGDKITSMKTYYVFADGNTAKTAFDALKKELEGQEQEQLANMELNGKYVIVTASEDSYKDLTASDVKQQIEFLEKLKNMNTDGDTSTVEEDVDVENAESDTETETEN